MSLPLRYLLVALAALGSAGLYAAALETGTAARQIDAILAKDWAANKLKGNPVADENTFVRRIYLDVVGRIPTTREADEFLNSKEPNKRALLIDKLLASEGYVQHSFNYWADVLRAQSNGQQAGQVTGAAYTQFIKQSLRDNKPYDQFVRDLVGAQGKAWDNGVLLGGGSAGSLCWFEHGTTDSRPIELSKVDGLGFIKGSHCPHYDAEAQRRPLYWSKIKSGAFKPGYACDNRAGIYFENEMVKQVVALDEKSNAYYVSKIGGEVNERLLPKIVLPA